MSKNHTSQAVDELLEDISNEKAYGENMGDEGDKYIARLTFISAKFKKMEETLEAMSEGSLGEVEVYEMAIEALSFDPLSNE